MDKIHVAAIALLALLAGVLVWQVSIHMRPLTVLTASKIEIDPKGYVTDDTLKGTYWSIVLIPSWTEEVGAYEFNDDVVHSGNANPYWQGKNLTVKNEIIIRIKPLQPYYSRKLTLSSVQVVPSAYQNWLNWLGQYGVDKDKADALYSGHYTFAESDWTLHTPFYVELLVNGAKVDSETVDTVGAVETVTLGTAPETVTISNLGKLSTGYSPPEWQDIIYFSNQYFYTYSDKIMDAMSNPYPAGASSKSGDATMTLGTFEDTYAWYWYGGAWKPQGEVVEYVFDRYWKETGTPCPISKWGVSNQIIWLNLDRHRPDSGEVPGWYDPEGEAGVTRRRPLTPPKYPTEKPSNREWALSLVEFLETRAGAKKPSMPSWLQGDVVVEDGYMKLYLPYGSMNNVLQALISAEIADTVVWHPLLSNIKITDFPDLGDVYENKKSSITVKQAGDLEAGGTIWFTYKPSDLEIGVDPPTIGIQDLKPGESRTYWFTIKNLAVLEDTPFTVTAKVTNSLGATTDTKTAGGTAKARSSVTTNLVVYTLDAKTRSPIGGVTVSVSYDTLSKTGVTSAGAVTFDFGSSSPFVTVTTTETTTYKSASTTKQLSTGPNTVELLLYKHGDEPPPAWWEWWWLIAIIVAIVVVVVLVIVYKKHWEG